MDPNQRKREKEGDAVRRLIQNGGAACGSPTAHSNKNMRNLDNQMMLYFSDKSLIFKLYYYVLVNTTTPTRGEEKGETF